MGDPFKKVQANQRLAIPAQTYNAFVDVALAHRARRQQQSQGPQPEVRHSGIVRVSNDTGGDRDQFAVVALRAPVVTPSGSPETFAWNLVLSAATPADSDFGKFGVLLEPLASGAVGWAVASGVVFVKIDIVESEHKRADVKDGSTAELKSDPLGSAIILWRAGSSGSQWALVKIGLPLDEEEDAPECVDQVEGKLLEDMTGYEEDVEQFLVKGADGCLKLVTPDECP